IDVLPLAGGFDDQAIFHDFGDPEVVLGHQGKDSLERCVAAGCYIDEHQLAFQMCAAGKVGHVQNPHQLIDLLDDLLNRTVVPCGDQCDAGDGRIESFRHSEPFNVVTARAEQTDDAGQLAVMVLHDDRKRMSHPSTMSAIPPPGGTMGKTFSSPSTMMSMTTTPGVERPCSRTALNSAGCRARRPVAP